MTNIEKNVMRRVRTIRALRFVLSGATVSCLLFVVALWGIGKEVWVARVFQNMPQPSDFFAVSKFYLFAFQNTHLLVQTLSLLALGSLLYLARETARLVVTLSMRLVRT